MYSKYSVPFQVGYDPTVHVTSESEGFVVLNIRIFEPTSGGAPGPFTLSVSTQEVTGGISIFKLNHLLCHCFIRIT